MLLCINFILLTVCLFSALMLLQIDTFVAYVYFLAEVPHPPFLIPHSLLLYEKITIKVWRVEQFAVTLHHKN